MSRDHRENLEEDIRKLLVLLKKIMRNHPHGSEQFAKLLDQKSFDLNLCFLMFAPMVPEDLAAFQDMYQDFLNDSDEPSCKSDSPKLEFKLSRTDLEFLKKNGIRF